MAPKIWTSVEAKLELNIVQCNMISGGFVACIWLLKIRMDKNKLVQFLRLQNPKIAMDSGGSQGGEIPDEQPIFCSLYKWRAFWGTWKGELQSADWSQERIGKSLPLHETG